MNINNATTRNDWNPIRNILREKYNTDGNNTSEKELSNKDYWNKFQQITGKSKEQIQNELRTF